MTETAEPADPARRSRPLRRIENGLDPSSLTGKIHTLLTSSDGAERVLVWAVWIAMSIAVLAYVYYFGRDVPYWEDWQHVPVLVGARPFNFAWLVEPVLEHRFVLAKLLLYPIWLTSHDFRAPMWVDASALIALSFFYLRGVRRIRGHVAFADAFFPLLLLSWGHHENLIFFVQIYYVLPVLLISAAMLSIAADGWRRFGGTISLGLVVMLLPLNGAVGALLSIPMALWCVWVGWAERRDARLAWPLWCGAAIAFIFDALTLLKYQTPKDFSAKQHSFEATVRGAFELLCNALGPSGAELWPLPAIGVFVICAWATILLLRVALRQPAERMRAAGLLACMASLALLILGVGYGRGVLGPGAGFPGRYCLVVAPALCVVFIAAQLYASGFLQRLVQMLLFVGTCIAFMPNLKTGVAYAHMRDEIADTFTADARSGLPSGILAQRYAPRAAPRSNELPQWISELRTAQIGPYKGMSPPLPPETPCRATQVEYKMLVANQVTFDHDIGRGTGDDPYIVYTLPQAIRVCGIKIEYDVDNANAGPALTQMYWKNSSANEEFEEASRNATISTKVSSLSATFWIYGTIDHFRFDPDVRPCTFRVRNVAFLIEDGK